MIEIDALSVTLRRQRILHSVTTTITGGEVAYLLGRNGAGKSTLLRAIAGIVRPDSGHITVNGAEIADARSPLREIGIHLGTDGVHPGHTGRRHLRWLATAGGVDTDRVDNLLERVGLGDAGHRRVSDYSLGMRQRLGIAAALLGDPRTLLLDEPLNGLDIDGIRWVRGLLAELAAEGRTLLIASHLFDEVTRTADRVLVIDRGTLVIDSPVDEFIGTHASLEDAYLEVTR